MPKSRTDFWHAKIARNQARDRKVSGLLKRRGWRVVRVWEHALDKPDRVVARIQAMLASSEQKH
jgi:DNA mismatch endonuclease (patch repair protein)